MADHNGRGSHDGDGNSSFDDILAMVCPGEASLVHKVSLYAVADSVAAYDILCMSGVQALACRGFHDRFLNDFAHHVQQDEGTEFTFSNLKAQ
jgi:hypothetical protein